MKRHANGISVQNIGFEFTNSLLFRVPGSALGLFILSLKNGVR